MSSRRSHEGTNQFNDAMTEESFICCSIKGEQMIYIDWPGSPEATLQEVCRRVAVVWNLPLRILQHMIVFISISKIM